MQETTVPIAENLQQVFRDSLLSGFWEGTKIMLPYIIGAMIISLLGTYIKAKIKKRKNKK